MFENIRRDALNTLINPGINETIPEKKISFVSKYTMLVIDTSQVSVFIGQIHVAVHIL